MWEIEFNCWFAWLWWLAMSFFQGYPQQTSIHLFATVIEWAFWSEPLTSTMIFSSSTPQNHQKKLVNHNKHTCTKTLNNIEETTQKQAAHSNVTHFRFLDGFAGSASSSRIWSAFFAALLDFALALALAFAAATALARSPFGRREGFGGFSACSALGKTDLTGNGG